MKPYQNQKEVRKASLQQYPGDTIEKATIFVGVCALVLCTQVSAESV